MTYCIYDRYGDEKVRLKEIEYNGEYMGDCYVETTVTSMKPIVWALGDYIVYRGETFTLNYIPSAKIQNSEWMYEYERIRFDSTIDELVRCTFKDVVNDEAGVHWTGMSTFSFYCDDVRSLAERIQANLDFTYGEGKWTVNVDPKYAKKKDRSISVNNLTVWDALTMAYEKFKANFIVRGRTITIGTEGKPLGHVFKFGIGNGLLSLERNSDSSQQIITRLRAYGNETNIPTNYYKYENCFVKTSMRKVFLARDPYLWKQAVVFQPNGKALGDEKYYWKTLSEGTDSNCPSDLSYTTKLVYDGKTTFAAVYKNKDDSTVRYISADEDFIKWAMNYKGSNVYVQGNSTVRMSKILKEHPEEVETKGYPNNMAVTRLMLPGFPTETESRSLGGGYSIVYGEGDVYIESPKVGSLNVREDTVFIDGTDNDVTDEDVYPSLEDMTVKQLKSAGISVDVPSDDNGCLDQFAFSQPVKDDGDNVDGTLKGTEAYVWTKDIGFNPRTVVISGQTAQVYIKSGMCAGQTFDITNIYEEKKEGHKCYRLTLKRKADELGFYIPNETYSIEAGDEFVFLGIRMPDVYVQAASERLLENALLYLKDNDTVHFTFTPELDPLFMERDRRKKGEKSLYMTIKEGDVLEFDESERLNVIGALFISSLSIKENQDGLPSYSITMEEKRSASTLSKVASQVSASLSGNYGGMTPSLVENLIGQHSEEYLKRKENDTAEGQIQMDGGMVSRSSAWDDAAADGLVEFYEEK